jgi:hypothetical protein
MNFSAYFPRLLSDLNDISITCCRALECWCMEGGTFLMGINEITCTMKPYDTL